MPRLELPCSVNELDKSGTLTTVVVFLNEAYYLLFSIQELT